MNAVLRAVAGYLFLIFVVRVVGRRPGKQLAPFEFVLIFFFGGLALTGIVGDERSFTNAVCQIISITLCHYALVWARSKSSRFARFIDGTPLLLFEHASFRSATLSKMQIQDDDVKFAARDHGFGVLSDIDKAVLERNGDISIVPRASAGADGS